MLSELIIMHHSFIWVVLQIILQTRKLPVPGGLFVIKLNRWLRYRKHFFYIVNKPIKLSLLIYMEIIFIISIISWVMTTTVPRNAEDF